MNLIFPLDKGWSIFCDCGDTIKSLRPLINILYLRKEKVNIIDCSDIFSVNEQRIELYGQMRELTGEKYLGYWEAFEFCDFPLFFKDGIFIGYEIDFLKYINKIIKTNILK